MTTKIKINKTAKDGSYACEIFVRDEDGNYVSTGFAVFASDGTLLQAYASLEMAIDHIESLNKAYDANRRKSGHSM